MRIGRAILTLCCAAVQLHGASVDVVSAGDRFDALYKDGSYMEAAELLVSACDQLVAIDPKLSQAEINEKIKILAPLLSFRTSRVVDLGKRYREVMSAARDRYLRDIERSKFTLAARPAVRAVATLNYAVGTPDATFEMYNKIPKSDRARFGLDHFVFDELWKKRRFDDVASTSWASRIIEARIAGATSAGDEKAYLERTKKRDLNIIGKTIVAMEKVNEQHEAETLRTRALTVFSAEELTAATQEAFAQLKKG